MFTDGNANCTPSWWERLATSSLLASQVSQLDVNHAQVTNGLDDAVEESVNGSLSYSVFASQWQSLLTSAAQQWATQNHVDLNKY